MTHIVLGAFSYLVNLTIIALPFTLESIGNGAFYKCENLKAINFY